MLFLSAFSTIIAGEHEEAVLLLCYLIVPLENISKYNQQYFSVNYPIGTRQQYLMKHTLLVMVGACG